MINILKLVRLNQWHKNFIILIPIFFSGQIQFENIFNSLIGFFIFCFLSSIIYIINDLIDKESDKKHIKKKSRPIAAGLISVQKISITLIFLIILLLSCVFYLNNSYHSKLFLILYFCINIFYSIGLKNIPILEMFLVTSGFIIRLVYGGLLIDVTLSNWIIVSVGLLSLLLIIGKRKADLSMSINTKPLYTLNFLNLLSSTVSSVVITAYLLFCLSDYAIDQFGSYTILSSIFVIYSVLHYLRLIILDLSTDDPSELFLKDPNIYLSVLLWFLFFTILIYVH